MIYPLDSAIQRLNNPGQVDRTAGDEVSMLWGFPQTLANRSEPSGRRLELDSGFPQKN